VTVVDVPAKPNLSAVEFHAKDSVALDVSPFTGQTQTQQWLGADMLSGTMTLPPLTQLQADAWLSFLMQLRGMANAFQIGDPMQPNIRGSASSPFGALVDNSVTGGNAAGSQTLGTQGWTANASGVLLQGDWLQVGYRLYRVLDDVNADGSGKALIHIWPSLREQPTSDGSSSAWLNATGSLGYTQSRPLGNNIAAVRWSGFTLPPGYVLPSDAVIQGIYPVIVASATHDVADSYYTYGNSGASFGAVSEGHGFTVPSDPSSQTFTSTLFYDTSIGTSLAALSAYKIKILLNTTANVDGLTDVVNATAIGFAIYYTSATPHTDPQIAAPFAVPSGQGLAWALPFTVEQSGVLAGCSGIFCPSTGYATGTPALDNGGLTFTGAKGLFRLASNDRVWSADVARLTKTSFPIQEYR
jgi:hypothetical protein